MSVQKIVLLGHYISTPTAMVLGKTDAAAKMQMQLFNYTRVATEDGQLMDHLAYLKRQRGEPTENAFSAWEMYLCASLLLASHLRRNGFAVKVVNYIDSDNADQAWQEIRDFGADIVAASTTFVLNTKQFMELGTKLRRECPDSFLMCGGHHVFAALQNLDESASGAYVEQGGFDCAVVDPQGENAFLQVAQAYGGDLSHIANLVYRDGVVMRTTERRGEDNNINDTLIEFEDTKPGDIAHIRTARSCSFKCAFCSYPSIAGPLATLTMDNARLTLERAMAANLGAIFFTDDTFNVPKDRFNELLDVMIEIGFNIPWYSFIRAQYIDEEIVMKMKKTGVVGVYLGVESGSNTILKNMKKGANVDFYRRGIQWLKDAGIITVGSFIMGFPGETEETVEITRVFIEESGLDYYYIQPFYYLHHTPVHGRADEWGLQGEGAFWNHDTMNWKQAAQHVGRLFFNMKNSTFINPDYTLWEIAYLHGKGMSLDEIKVYREDINAMTRDQMCRFGLYDKDVVVRVTRRSGV